MLSKQSFKDTQVYTQNEDFSSSYKIGLWFLTENFSTIMSYFHFILIGNHAALKTKTIVIIRLSVHLVSGHPILLKVWCFQTKYFKKICIQRYANPST